jgi:hypothetical integral membrane protein (TIGR02206 family)
MPATQPITFRPFGATHAVVLVVFVVFTCAIVALRRRARGERGRRRVDGALAVLTGLTWLVVNGWWFLPGHFDPAFSLPLHVCDVTGLVVPVVLVWPRRWLRAILYFWGLGLSLQGFIQPDLRDGPHLPGFWLFWANHYVVVGLSIYDLAARAYRPRWRDFAVSVVAGLGYVAVVLPIDVIFGLNYGYLGPGRPHQPTLIDHLGPWPWRLGVIFGLVALVWVVMVLPWELSRRRANTPAVSPR